MKSSISLEDLLQVVESYNKENVDKIVRAYEYAFLIHGNQTRKSGELYISHPLNVAYILASIGADSDTICACLLHDVIEDGDNITKEDIAREFNEVIATLVDGVTKMKLELFSDKKAQNDANTRKVIMGMKNDVRIIIIKLVDRLHNMMTLKYLPRNKQIQNSLETLEIFVPLAERLGLYVLKNNLEELAFKYLNEDVYNLLDERRSLYMDSKKLSLEQMKSELGHQLAKQHINNDISYRFKRNYAVYKGINSNSKPKELLDLDVKDVISLFDSKIGDIHDLQSLKVLVSNLEECYSSLEVLWKNYEIIPGKIKNCILEPKTNGYRSLHTTILDCDFDKLQTQIRTNDMDGEDLLGIAYYWHIFSELAPYYMHKDLYDKFPFFRSLLEIDKNVKDDGEFVMQTKMEILSKMVYPHAKDGRVIELPVGATIMDFICRYYDDIDNKVIAVVNGRVVPLNYVLHSKDDVELIPVLNQKLSYVPDEVVTIKAKQKLRSIHG